MSAPDNAPPFPPPAAGGRWRDRAVVLAPALAFGSVLLTLWVLVGWWLVDTPRQLRQEQREQLAATVRGIGLQTEPVLRQAETALHTVDLWLLAHAGTDPLADPALPQLAERVQRGSRGLVDIVLVARTGQVRRLRSGEDDGASIAGTPAFDQFSGVVPEGLVIAEPLRLGGRRQDGRRQLPLLMRLSRPLGEYQLLAALVDLEALLAAQRGVLPGPPASLVLLRGDGLALLREPEAPGFAGRNIFEQFPHARRHVQAPEGFTRSTGAASDGVPRVGAYTTLGDFGLKLVLSDSEDRVLVPHWRHRTAVLLAAALLSVGLFLLARRLVALQREARLREAGLRATGNAMPLGWFRTDETGRIVYANDGYLRVHGLKAEDVGWGWTTLVKPENRDMLIQRWKHHMASGEPLDAIARMRRGDDNRIRWIAVRSAPVLLDGRVAGQAGIVEDVTERAEQERARRTLAAIFDLTPDFVCQARESGDLTYLNPAARQRFGMTADAPLEGLRIEQFFSAEQIENFRRRVLPTAVREGHWHGRTSLQVGGQRLPVDCTVLAHRDLRGRIETVSVILRDMSEQVQAQRERERSEAMLLAVAHTARAQFVVGDTEGRVIFFNAALEQQRGVRLQDWIGRPLAALFGPADHGLREPLIRAALAGETHRVDLADGTGRDGRSFEVQYAPLRVYSGDIEGVIGIEVDVTEARREQAQLRLASQTDALTQLLNRAGFEEGARRLLADPAAAGLTLLCLDLDGFKPVNDRHGHPTGDALLKAVALRLRHALRPADLVGRLGGDEFAVLLPLLQDSAAASAVAAKLLQAISAPYHIGELELVIGVSIGFCVAPAGHGAGLERLVAAADAQLYEAKRAGRGRWRGTAL
jgi:diguanylate cyclase (GGDEF)-like protein/PAS domain S-box-containing protein